MGAENPPVQGDSGRRYVPLEPNWDAPWPERVVVPGFLLVKTVQETEELSVYETDHFIMESPGKLPEAERMILARRFETILSALAAVPLNLAVARRPSRKYLVRVCFQEEDFNRAPGLRNGHLKFSPTSFTALLLRDKKGKLLKPGLDPRFAVTHWAAQSMDWDHWLVDGFSAYMAFLPMEKEAPVFRKIPERLAAMVPRAVRTGREALPALADMLSRDSAHSAAEHGVSSRGGTLQYWADLLWMVYWSHLEGSGKAERLRSYLRVRDAEGGGKARAVCWMGRLRRMYRGKWPRPGKNGIEAEIFSAGFCCRGQGVCRKITGREGRKTPAGKVWETCVSNGAVEFSPYPEQGKQKDEDGERIRVAPEQDARFHGRRHREIPDFLNEPLYFLSFYHAPACDGGHFLH